MEDTKTLEVRVEQKLGLLNWNFDELNAQLDAQLEKYRGLTFTDDQMPEAKKTRAALNKVATEINDRKIAVKREFCAPYEQFEEQAKTLIGKIKDVSGEIDQQVKAYEESKKEEKRRRIEAWWAENGKRTVPLEKIFDGRWLNATCSDAKWQSDLQTVKTRITNEIYTITMMAEDGGPDKLDFLLAEYMKKLSLEETVKAWKAREEAVKRAAEERERIERERQQEEEKRAQAAANPAPQPALEEPATQDGPEAYLYSPTFKLIDLEYQEALALTKYMKDHRLRFVSIAKEKRRK